MRREGFSLEYVDVMIDFIESKIENNAVTPQILSALQKRLDEIDEAHRKDRKYQRYYPRMLELQTLIYGEGKQEEQALQCLKEAVRQTGSAAGLSSTLLKRYIANHIRSTPSASSANNLSRHVSATARETSKIQHRRGSVLRRLKVGLITVIIVAGVAAGLLRFVPRAAALPVLLLRHSEISHEKQTYENLTAQYQACSSSLARRKGSVDPNDMAAVDTFDKDAKSCNAVLQKLHQTATQYDNLIGVVVGSNKP